MANAKKDRQHRSSGPTAAAFSTTSVARAGNSYGVTRQVSSHHPIKAAVLLPLQGARVLAIATA
jgi:hypothetical protein